MVVVKPVSCLGSESTRGVKETIIFSFWLPIENYDSHQYLTQMIYQEIAWECLRYN